jgi:inosine/xanthosine triphosphate pyrophosphatase family protein
VHEVDILRLKGQINKACVTEDTSLHFDALNGLPGPYIKDFMTKLGHEGEFGAETGHERWGGGEGSR